MLSILKNFLVKRALAPVAAGTTTQYTSWMDMQSFQTIMFIAGIGTQTSTNVFTPTIQVSNDQSTIYDLPATFDVPDTQSNKLALIEVVRPGYRYVRLKIARTTANAVIDLVVAILGYYPKATVPLTQDTGSGQTTSYGNQSWVSPAHV